MKIYIKYHNENCKLEIKGNWIDLKASKAYKFTAPTLSYFTKEAENIPVVIFDKQLIDLGVSMKLPKYFQANIVPRSSLGWKKDLIQLNHFGVIDGPDAYGIGYSGNNDIWKFPALALALTTIEEGERICQFTIQPTQFAPWYTKLKWIFSKKIQFIEVNNLGDINRGGFGSTGK